MNEAKGVQNAAPVLFNDGTITGVNAKFRSYDCLYLLSYGGSNVSIEDIPNLNIKVIQGSH
jgi:hypothetical protein